MKLDVLLASRGHPKELETTIRVLQGLESEKHEISYLVGLDNDDRSVYPSFQGNIQTHYADRPVCFGAVWNRLARVSTADYVMLLGDGPLCLTPHWDEIAAGLIKDRLMFSSLWIYEPGLPNMPVISRKWLEAAGNIYTELVPFWFTDRWLIELYEFTTGEAMPQTHDIAFAGKPGKTGNMHDLEFWWGFYNACRKKRIQEAVSIAGKLGIKPNVDGLAERLTYWNTMDKAMRPKIPELEKYYSTGKPKSDLYRQAKQNALDYLHEHGLTLWQNML